MMCNVNMTDNAPPQTTSAAPETKQSFLEEKAQSYPLSPVEQSKLLFLFSLFIYLFIYIDIYTLFFKSTISEANMKNLRSDSADAQADMSLFY